MGAMNKPTFIIKYLNRTATEDRTSQNAWPNFSLIRLLAFRGILESTEEQNDVTYYISTLSYIVDEVSGGLWLL